MHVTTACRVVQGVRFGVVHVSATGLDEPCLRCRRHLGDSARHVEDPILDLPLRHEPRERKPGDGLELTHRFWFAVSVDIGDAEFLRIDETALERIFVPLAGDAEVHGAIGSGQVVRDFAGGVLEHGERQVGAGLGSNHLPFELLDHLFLGEHVSRRPVGERHVGRVEHRPHHEQCQRDEPRGEPSERIGPG